MTPCSPPKYAPSPAPSERDALVDEIGSAVDAALSASPLRLQALSVIARFRSTSLTPLGRDNPARAGFVVGPGCVVPEQVVPPSGYNAEERAAFGLGQRLGKLEKALESREALRQRVEGAVAQRLDAMLGVGRKILDLEASLGQIAERLLETQLLKRKLDDQEVFGRRAEQSALAAFAKELGLDGGPLTVSAVVAEARRRLRNSPGSAADEWDASSRYLSEQGVPSRTSDDTADVPLVERIRQLLDARPLRIDASTISAIRDAALEEAAKVADGEATRIGPAEVTGASVACVARSIRALKSKPAPKPPIFEAMAYGTQEQADEAAKEYAERNGMALESAPPDPVHDFGWALQQMRESKKVRRKSSLTPAGLDSQAIDMGWVQMGRGRLSWESMSATDWEVVA